MRRKTIALSILVLMVFCAGCPQKPANFDKKKAAVYSIQHGVDGAADTLAALSASGKITPQEAGEIAKLLLPVNKANNSLIDAAWNSDPTIQGKLDALDKAIQGFVNSGVVIKNAASQAAIKTLVDTLLKDISILKGK